MTDEEEKRSRFVARIKALPAKEQAAFWRGIMAVVGQSRSLWQLIDMAKYWKDFYTELKEHNK